MPPVVVKDTGPGQSAPAPLDLTKIREHFHLWGLPPSCTPTLLNHAENITVLLEDADGGKSVLRIHRPGYQSRAAIRSEFAWIRALRAEEVISTPDIIPGCNGHAIQSGVVGAHRAPRLMVLFAHVPGHHPDESGDLATLFPMLGRLAARLHDHAARWQPPDDFTRPHWNLERVLGHRAIWGNWQDAPLMTGPIRNVLDQAATKLCHRLHRYGTHSDRYGLIHADMRLANIIVRDSTRTLIDFDDCGFGWLLADFAAATSFLEHLPMLGDLWTAWSAGYQEVRPLPPEHRSVVPSLVMLRRLALLAWITSRSDSSEPRRLAPTFAADTAEMATRYLAGTLLH